MLTDFTVYYVSDVIESTIIQAVHAYAKVLTKLVNEKDPDVIESPALLDSRRQEFLKAVMSNLTTMNLPTALTAVNVNKVIKKLKDIDITTATDKLDTANVIVFDYIKLGMNSAFDDHIFKKIYDTTLVQFLLPANDLPINQHVGEAIRTAKNSFMTAFDKGQPNGFLGTPLTTAIATTQAVTARQNGANNIIPGQHAELGEFIARHVFQEFILTTKEIYNVVTMALQSHAIKAEIRQIESAQPHKMTTVAGTAAIAERKQTVTDNLTDLEKAQISKKHDDITPAVASITKLLKDNQGKDVFSDQQVKDMQDAIDIIITAIKEHPDQSTWIQAVIAGFFAGAIATVGKITAQNEFQTSDIVMIVVTFIVSSLSGAAAHLYDNTANKKAASTLESAKNAKQYLDDEVANKSAEYAEVAEKLPKRYLTKGTKARQTALAEKPLFTDRVVASRAKTDHAAISMT